MLATFAAIAVHTSRSLMRERSRAEALARLRQTETDAEARRETLSRVIETQERERRRLAQDLHDRTAGGLTSVLFALRRLERELADDEQRAQLSEARAGVSAAIEDVRDLIADLRPKVLDDFGLGPALERLCATVERRSGLALRAELGAGLDSLPPDVATAVYRIVQEALGNVVRHAEARSVGVTAAILGDRWWSRSRTTARASAPEAWATASRACSSAPGWWPAGSTSRAGRWRGAGSLRDADRAVVIRALLVDDHQIVRSGVRKVLEATGRFEVVGEAAGVAEALEHAGLLRPDVVVLDLALRDGSGLDAIAELRELGARVVILSMQDEPAYARKAFELGAQGYVVKDAADEELADAIDAVLGDRIYVHPALAARLVMAEPDDDLTERERQILRLIALGYTNQEIAGQLFLSVRTIEAHRRHILDKLRLSTRADLVRYALERRIVEIGPLTEARAVSDPRPGRGGLGRRGCRGSGLRA